MSDSSGRVVGYLEVYLGDHLHGALWPPIRANDPPFFEACPARATIAKLFGVYARNFD
jgi:hypothetical protein